METYIPKPKQHEISVDIDRNKFALALKTWRLRRALTQRQVADMWQVSRYTIMRAEAGKNITWMMAYRLFARLSDNLRKEAQDECQI